MFKFIGYCVEYQEQRHPQIFINTEQVSKFCQHHGIMPKLNETFFMVYRQTAPQEYVDVEDVSNRPKLPRRIKGSKRK